MSVLRPISSISYRNSGSGRAVAVGLFLGLALGTIGGFLAARYTNLLSGAPVEPPAPAEAATEFDQQVPPVSAAAAPLQEEEQPPGEKYRRLDARISGSLYATLAKELEEGREADILNAQLGRILAWWFDLRRDVLKGDRVQMLFRTPDNPTVLSVIAIRYSSEKNLKTYAAYLFKPEGAAYGRYYDENGQEIEQRMVKPPLEQYEQVTELMDLAGRRHRGVDFKTDVGTPVLAPFKARILRRNWHTHRNGLCLEIKYLDSGVQAFFLHLDEVPAEIAPGKVVEAGAVIARSGNSGRSTAPHLHYELRSSSGKLLNPFEFHQTTRLKLEGRPLEEFMAHRDRLNRILEGEPAQESAPSPPAPTSAKARAR